MVQAEAERERFGGKEVWQCGHRPAVGEDSDQLLLLKMKMEGHVWIPRVSRRGVGGISARC